GCRGLQGSRPIEVDSRIVSPYMKLRDGRLRSRNPCCTRSEADPVTVNADWTTTVSESNHPISHRSQSGFFKGEVPMGSSLKRRSLTSAIGATVVVSAALALFSFATWAGRNQDQAGRHRSLGEHGKRGEIAPGFDAVQISESALASRSLDDIATELKAMGVKVHDVLESRALLVEVPAGAVDKLAHAGYIEAGLPWGAMFR